MYFHPDVTVEAAARIGIGLTAGPVFIGFDGIDRLPWPDRLRFAEDFVARHRGTEGVACTPMPHSAYTLDAGKLAEVAALSDRLGVALHVHAAEAPSEMALVAAQHGTTPVRGAPTARGMIRPGTLLAHAVHLDAEEIALLAERAAWRWRIVRCRTPSSPRAPHSWGGVARRGSSPRLAPTARQAAMTSTCSTRCGWRRIWRSLPRASPTRCPRARSWRWPPAAEPGAAGLGGRKGVIAPGRDADVCRHRPVGAASGSRL